jgi:hypothetical protein
MNDDNMMFDYLLQMGAMRPEQEELRKRQAMVDALRGNAMAPMQGEMIGKHYVSPGIAGAVGQLAQGYMAGQAQKGVDARALQMNQNQKTSLENMRKERERLRMLRLGGRGGGMPSGGMGDPYGNLPTYGNEA